MKKPHEAPGRHDHGPRQQRRRSATGGAAARRAAGRAVLGVAVLLQACTILPKAEPLDVYLLPAAAPAAAAPAQPAPWSLRIARPAAGAHLAGQRIVVMPEDNRVSVYKGAGWADPAPLLVRNRLLDAFRADGRIAALSSDDKHLQADFELDSDLRAFQSEYRAGRPEAVIRLDARLVHTASRRVVASRTFEQRQAAGDPAVPAVVEAFGAAGDRLAAEVAAWTVREAAAAAAAATAAATAAAR